MNTQSINFHYIMVIVFPRDGYAVIWYCKQGWTNINAPTFYIHTKRRVSFDYALKYMIRHNMKMEKDKQFSDMFHATKG